MGALKVNTNNFVAEVKNSPIPVLVDFWAEWCGPCRMIGPVVEEIAQEMTGKLKVVKINVDENAQTPQTYGITAIPTLILYKGGQLKEKIVGFMPKAKFAELLAKHI